MTEHLFTAFFYLVLSAGLTTLLVWMERQTVSGWRKLLGDYLTHEGVAWFIETLFWFRLYGWLFNSFILACSLDHIAADVLGHASPWTNAIATIEAVVSGVTALLFVGVPLYHWWKKWKS